MKTPDRAGQPVRSHLDGTLGVTASGVDSSGYIDVMFIGSIGTTPFRTHELTVIELKEA